MKFRIIYALAALCTLMSSCNLDEFPKSEVAAEEYVKDDNSLNNLVIGCYNNLHDVMYYEWAVTEVRSDNARLYNIGSSSSTTKLAEQLDQGVVGAEHAWVSSYWNAAYSTIGRCNNVLEYLDKASSMENRNKYEGEAKFLRSLQFFNLVRLWGPVFKVTSKLTSEEARSMQRSSVDEIYDQIEADLCEIIDLQLLPEVRNEAELGRADLIAVKALLAKVYATRYAIGDEKYGRAAELCLDVLHSIKVGNPSSAADLVPYAQIFSTQNEMNKEIIFAVRYIGGRVGLGSPFGNLFAPVNNGTNVIVGTSNNFNCPSDNILAAYDMNDEIDLRRDVNLAESYFNSATGQVVTKDARYVKKYLNIDQEQSPITTQYDGDADWPVIRVGDIALLYAELINEINGPTADAFKYLNMVHERAGLTPYTFTQLSSQYDFRQAVRQERRLELAFENQRWFDLLRWGIAQETVNRYFVSEPFYSSYSYSVNPLAEWQLYLPIPIDVININPNVSQNFGY